MKLLEAVKNQKVTGTILASALTIGSFGAISAFAANGSDAIPKNTVITASAPAASSVAVDSTQQTIEYSKDTYTRADGSQNFSQEHWYDPQTKDFRTDLMEYSSDHQLLRYQSSYYLDGFNKLVVIQRDKDGNVLSAKTLNRSDDPSAFEKLDQKNLAFSGVKNNYKASYWTPAGTEQTADGKTLNKLMDSYQSYIDDNTQANMQYVVYLDKDSGLPTKEELFEDSTGTFKLFSTDTDEYKYVANDGSIFQEDGITPTPVKTGAEVFAE